MIFANSKHILLLLLIFGFLSSAQTQRFIYELEFKPDSTSAKYEKTNMVLDINSNEVKFYEYDLLRMDSINKKNDNYGLTTWGSQNIVTRQRNTFKNKNYEMLEELYAYKSDDPIQWKLTNETKTLDKYNLQKATTNFGGRLWTAWFCKDIPINEGPYKFRGLPGLIIQIQDSKDQFIYSMIESKTFKNTFNSRDFIENYGGNKPLEISFKIFQKKKLEDYNDPFREFRLEFDENPDTSYFYNNTKITSKDQLKTMEKKFQEDIRRENNPVEIDKVIHYPEG